MSTKNKNTNIPKLPVWKVTVREWDSNSTEEYPETVLNVSETTVAKAVAKAANYYSESFTLRENATSLEFEVELTNDEEYVL